MPSVANERLAPKVCVISSRTTAAVCLEKGLIFALEVALEDNAANLRALFAERLLRAEVGAIERWVMRHEWSLVGLEPYLSASSLIQLWWLRRSAISN
jgi:hypothetical protein